MNEMLARLADESARAAERRVHDRDRCPICYDARCVRLRRRGVSRAIWRELRACGPAGLPMLRALEEATPAQAAALNEAATARLT